MENKYEGRQCRKCHTKTRYIKTNDCVFCKTGQYKMMVDKKRKKPRGTTYEGAICNKCKTTTKSYRTDRCMVCARISVKLTYRRKYPEPEDFIILKRHCNMVKIKRIELNRNG